MPVKEKKYLEPNEEQLEAIVDDEAQEIDLVELFFRLLEKAWIIAVVAVIGAACMGLYTHFCVKPTYSSTAKLYVVNNSGTTINLSDLNLGDKVAEDFVQVFNNQDVYDMVKLYMKREYGTELKYSFSSIQRMMNVSVINDTRILKITVTCDTPDEAMRIATAYAETAKDFITATMKMDEPTDFELAREGKENSPGLVKNVILGFLMGAVAAAAVIIVMFIVDDRIRTAEQLQKHLGLATLGMMPVQEADRKKSKKMAKGERK